MAREFARRFYKSKAWESARAEALARSHGLCEVCMRHGRTTPGQIVHHKVHLNPSNITDASVTLNQDNLEVVCRDCHADSHPEIYGRDENERPRVAFDDYGNVVRRDNG